MFHRKLDHELEGGHYACTNAETRPREVKWFVYIIQPSKCRAGEHGRGWWGVWKEEGIAPRLPVPPFLLWHIAFTMKLSIQHG